ncbi:MAG: DUF6476 family protein [Proteobacteria bacterium]|nr:DUF6476 family protein [Pseudomonadota bacterium]
MKLQALKVLVVIMGVLIFVGLGFLAYGLAAKFGGSSAISSGSAVSALKPLSVMLPKGAEVTETTLSENRLLVRLTLSDGSIRLLIFDVTDGRQIGAINLKRAP